MFGQGEFWQISCDFLAKKNTFNKQLKQIFDLQSDFQIARLTQCFSTKYVWHS